ncbi:hypothetical protein FRC12_023317 [Ceratobasidium sp. 428]|nr:hypothetical protein FRC12_023317 [Ceratobasidium sp. 428]
MAGPSPLSRHACGSLNPRNITAIQAALQFNRPDPTACPALGLKQGGYIVMVSARRMVRSIPWAKKDLGSGLDD